MRAYRGRREVAWCSLVILFFLGKLAVADADPWRHLLSIWDELSFKYLVPATPELIRGIPPKEIVEIAKFTDVFFDRCAQRDEDFVVKAFYVPIGMGFLKDLVLVPYIRKLEAEGEPIGGNFRFTLIYRYDENKVWVGIRGKLIWFDRMDKVERSKLYNEEFPLVKVRGIWYVNLLDLLVYRIVGKGRP